MSVKSDSDILYIDYPMVKRTLPNGEMKIYKNSEALSQALKIWVASGRGEKIRSDSGGYVTPFLGKPLSDEVASSMRKNILHGLQVDFIPQITVIQLDVIPNQEKRAWIINLVGYNEDLAIGVNTSITISNIP